MKDCCREEDIAVLALRAEQRTVLTIVLTVNSALSVGWSSQPASSSARPRCSTTRSTCSATPCLRLQSLRPRSLRACARFRGALEAC
jgi:hypothetical protein